MILDIHTHHAAPQPQGIISVDVDNWQPVEGQFYSVGIHPWRDDMGPSEIELLRQTATHPSVMAIGECGLDVNWGAPMYSQILTLRACVEIAVGVGKPMIIHDVKSHAQLIAMHKEYAPEVNWVIHGFRGKPTVAQMLIKEGFYLSFGKQFNPDTLRAMPPNRILAETDESTDDIGDIITSLSAVRADIDDFKQLIENNTAAFLNYQYAI